jgi:hypothetical protein
VTRNEARRIDANVAKLPELLRMGKCGFDKVQPVFKDRQPSQRKLVTNHWEGDWSAQVCEQLSCWVVQFDRQIGSPWALPMVMVLPSPWVMANVPVMHDDWQLAHELLHVIMQVVTAEDCASLIFPAASAPPASPTMLVVSNMYKDARALIIP